MWDWCLKAKDQYIQKQERYKNNCAFGKLYVVGCDRTGSVGTEGGWQVWCAVLRNWYLILRAKGVSEVFQTGEWLS